MIHTLIDTNRAHRRNTANNPKPPQTTPNYRKPPFSYLKTVERVGNGCDIATIRAPLAFKYASVGMEGSGRDSRSDMTSVGKE